MTSHQALKILQSTTGLLLLLSQLSLFISSPVMAAESFGRLFTTPVERSSLDYLRQTTKAPVLNETPEAVTEIVPAAPVIPQPISMQGYVKRSDGKKGTVWVNNQPIQEGSSNSEVEVGKLGKDASEVKLKVPSTGKDFNLKAGQVYLPESNSISEVAAHKNMRESNKSLEEGSIGSESPVQSESFDLPKKR